MSKVKGVSKIKEVTSKSKANKLLKKGWVLIDKSTRNEFWCSGDGFHEGYRDVTRYTMGKPRQ